MLLAAGRGERMRPLTDHTPKPLLQVGGKALIVWHIENMARAGIFDLVINHAYLGNQIEAALGDGDQFGVRIRYSAENPVLETAGGIANALPLLGDAPFAVINSDIYCDYDFFKLPELAAALGASEDTAYLVLVNNPAHHPNGDFGLSSGKTVNSVPLFTFSGIGIYQPGLFANIPRGTVAPLAPLLRAQIALGKVSGEHYRGRWLDVGTPQRLEKLDNELRSQHNATHV
ncbi:N-acetylmuramate alpha-1-phosphate uridylyltransferase [Candidatus Nitrotoga sp. HW29]|uniref:N-acetylmuramate alpha-1-phosphate uridylyltransferase MurU n=1 Tax=Candidatus Nitrotoga sp. HW29 TaxID=2886963 RepID=UPI001F9A4A27|nr:nucleotidyltransferase family protein [Candidatus Nitrotoga sp. HW29]CAH1903869.1 N-acetylmuramate alpha-1-phosphate uridylyltransferase [Candidatus Nitrotoga sp. HW29]